MRHVKIPLEQLVILLMDESGTKAARGPNGPALFPVGDVVPDMERAHLGCPLCGDTTTLYENVEITGWMTVNGHELLRDGDKTVVAPTNRNGPHDREADWDAVDHVGYACSRCCRDGDNLTQLALVCEPKKGWDGEPLRPPMPGQESLIPDPADTGVGA